jgi:hypothetical protein
VHAARDRAAGDDHDVDARAMQRRDLLDDPGDHGQPDLARVLGHDRRTQLDDGYRHPPGSL